MNQMISRRDYFAGMIAQALFTSRKNQSRHEDVCYFVTMIADELVKQLDATAPRKPDLYEPGFDMKAYRKSIMED